MIVLSHTCFNKEPVMVIFMTKPQRVSVALFSVVVVTLLNSSVGYGFLPNCSGNVQGSGLCSQPRFCIKADNPQCLTKVSVSSKTLCKSGVAGDNCVNTTQTDVCGSRYTCQLNVGGTACVEGAKLGDIFYNLPTDGGDCIAGG